LRAIFTARPTSSGRNAVNQTVGALRFFFVKMLKRPWGVEENALPEEENAFARTVRPSVAEVSVIRHERLRAVGVLEIS
jgi:hypothetical protein